MRHQPQRRCSRPSRVEGGQRDSRLAYFAPRPTARIVGICPLPGLLAGALLHLTVGMVGQPLCRCWHASSKRTAAGRMECRAKRSLSPDPPLGKDDASALRVSASPGDTAPGFGAVAEPHASRRVGRCAAVARRFAGRLLKSQPAHVRSAFGARAGRGRAPAAAAVARHGPRHAASDSSTGARRGTAAVLRADRRDARLSRSAGRLRREFKRLEIWPEELAAAQGARATPKRPRTVRALSGLSGFAQRARSVRRPGTVLGGAPTCCAKDKWGPLAGVRHVFVDGFTDFTRTEHDVLELLAARAERLVISLPWEAESPAAASCSRKCDCTLEQLQARHAGLDSRTLAAPHDAARRRLRTWSAGCSAIRAGAARCRRRASRSWPRPA